MEAMTAKQELLYAMRKISEGQWSCGWYSGLEYLLWDMVNGKLESVGHMTTREGPHVAAYLKGLAEESGGWWSWRDGWSEPGPIFFEMEEWLSMVSEKEQNKEK